MWGLHLGTPAANDWFSLGKGRAWAHGSRQARAPGAPRSLVFMPRLAPLLPSDEFGLYLVSWIGTR